MKTFISIFVPEPLQFYCSIDERNFFNWLKEIHAISKYAGTPAGLNVLVSSPIDRASFYEFAGLLTRYSIDLKWLLPLAINHPDKWFSDKQNYWYEGVFSSVEN